MINTDDPEAMQIAFEQFMLSSSSSSKNKRNSESDQKRREEIEEEKKKRDLELKLSRFHQKLKKIEKRYWQIFRSFRETVKEDWIRLDDELERVVQSISNIRNRLPLEMALFQKLDQTKKNTPNIQKWMNHGLRRSKKDTSRIFSSDECLTIGDVDQSISHDLIQHEKMMTGLRKLLSDLTEAQKRLGVLLEDMTEHHLSVVSEMSRHTENPEMDDASFMLNPSHDFPMHLIDHMNDVFQVLSFELYRKQILVQLLLVSTSDKLLLSEEREVAMTMLDDENKQVDLDAATESDPRSIASMCCTHWPRSSSFSSIDQISLDSFLRQQQRQ